MSLCQHEANKQCFTSPENENIQMTFPRTACQEHSKFAKKNVQLLSKVNKIVFYLMRYSQSARRNLLKKNCVKKNSDEPLEKGVHLTGRGARVARDQLSAARGEARSLGMPWSNRVTVSQSGPAQQI